MIIMDKFSKASHFILVKSTHKSCDIAKILMKEIFRWHGLPKVIVTYIRKIRVYPN